VSKPIVFARMPGPGEPTQAQKESGNYRKRKVAWNGLMISVENEAGTYRRGRSRTGHEWATLMHWAYGYVNGSMGVDGDEVDCYLGPDDTATMVYVVHQRRYGDWGAYDEDKAMLNFSSEADAVAAFLACYDDPRFLGPITAMPVAEFVAKVRATKDRPAMVKAVVFAKSHVRGYTRADGTYVKQHEDKRARKPKKAVQVDLFAFGGDPRRDALEALKKRVTKYASGLSRTKDFATTAWAGHGVGVEIGEMSDDAMRELARVVVDYRTPAFVDSGAFGVFMRGLKRENVEGGGQVEGLDFDSILARYDTLLDMIQDYNEAEESVPPPLLVMPDVVGDQLASLALIHKHRDYVRATAQFRGVARPIIPIQRGPLPMAEAYRRLVDMLGTDDFIVGVPSNAAAVTPEEFTAFLREAKPRAVHILGAFADSRLTPRLNQILDSGIADQVEVTADANPLRSIIIEKGQTGPERRATLADKLGESARAKELEQVIRRHGGVEAMRAHYDAADGDRQRRMVGLISDLSGEDEGEVLKLYGLRPPKED
jgi:hypothetical protein